MNPLEHKIVNHIHLHGALRFDNYMRLCALHPRHGYYNRPDPVGSPASFTTSPEISQMFGELIGVCFARHWVLTGKPRRCNLLELGPGRGTLMSDLLRAASQVSELVSSSRVVLCERSRTLQEQQHERLKSYRPRWTRNLEGVGERTTFAIANEFFDALAVRQFRRTRRCWQELHVAVNHSRLVPVFLPLQGRPPGYGFERVKPGSIVEWRPEAVTYMQQLSGLVNRNGGLALIVDYGEARGSGDTIQAIAGNEFAEPFETPGRADISAHVDFGALAVAAGDRVAVATSRQGTFLKRLGIEQRARILARGLSGDMLRSHVAALHRLGGTDAMGSLFKVMALYRKGAPLPPGFA